MVGPGMFSEAFASLFIVVLFIGVALGLLAVGLGWLVYWLWCHIDIVWIP